MPAIILTKSYSFCFLQLPYLFTLYYREKSTTMSFLQKPNFNTIKGTTRNYTLTLFNAHIGSKPTKTHFEHPSIFTHHSSFLLTDHTNSILTSCYSSLCLATRNLFRLLSSDMLGLFSSSPFNGMLRLSS